MIRQAELRDLSDIENLFLKLLLYLMDLGEEWYVRDSKELQNGIVAYILGALQAPTHIVLVSEDRENTIDGFLLGTLLTFPSFYHHKLMGRIDWLYPLQSQARQLIEEFECWAKSQNATTLFANSNPNNELALKLYKREGWKLAWNNIVKTTT